MAGATGSIRHRIVSRESDAVRMEGIPPGSATRPSLFSSALRHLQQKLTTKVQPVPILAMQHTGQGPNPQLMCACVLYLRSPQTQTLKPLQGLSSFLIGALDFLRHTHRDPWLQNCNDSCCAPSTSGRHSAAPESDRKSVV